MNQSAQQFKLWQRLRKRLIGFFIFAVVVMVFMALRLFQLQVVQGAEYYEKSQRVITKVVPLPAPRGEMFDRNYKSREDAEYIVSNRTTLNLIAIPSHFQPNELFQLTAKLEKVIERPAGSLQKLITETKLNQNEEIVLVENLTPREHTRLADYYISLSKFIVRQSTERNYEKGPVAAHITGYVGPPTHADIERGIRSYQIVGKNGLEDYYDNILRGEDGEIVQIKTARGDVEEQKVFRNFVPGNNLVLTIDMRLQQAAYEAMEGYTGAVMAIKPATGEIMALVSKPDYDPNILVNASSEDRIAHLTEVSKNQAELNRAIGTKYPPASTFKPMVALAALEENKLTPEKSYFCPGKFTLKSSYRGLPDTTFHCYGVHRHNDLTSAIAQSCSVYFYEVGYHIGAEPIIKYARYFKLNQKTGIDLPGERPGFIPSPLWKEKEKGMRWFDGDTINLSIGQGFIQTTLAGVINFYAGLVTDGIVYKPHLIKEIRYAENDKIKEIVKPELHYELPISKKTLKAIREGLKQASLVGTTRHIFRGAPIAVAGKTGTAQTISTDRKANQTQHAWYMGFAPYDGNLEDIIVVGAIIERGQWGSVAAAPVARKVFYTWDSILKQRGKSSGGNT